MAGNELDSSAEVIGLDHYFLLLVGLLSAPPCGLTTYLRTYSQRGGLGVVAFLTW